MEMKLLAIGDVVGDTGLKTVTRCLGSLLRDTKADFCIVNGENASMTGILPRQAEEIYRAGADVVTLGNHVWNRREIVPLLEEGDWLLRPANLSPAAPGIGDRTFSTAKGTVRVINLIGRCGMDFSPDNPFLLAERLLRANRGEQVTVVEIHAEATSEKLAMVHLLDGKVSVVYGTHTHVATADLSIFPGGTGYVTDLGMTGPANGVLGVRADQSVSSFRGAVTGRYEQAPGPGKLEGALFTIDTATGKTVAVERIFLHD